MGEGIRREASPGPGGNVTRMACNTGRAASITDTARPRFMFWRGRFVSRLLKKLLSRLFKNVWMQGPRNPEP